MTKRRGWRYDQRWMGHGGKLLAMVLPPLGLLGLELRRLAVGFGGAAAFARQGHPSAAQLAWWSLLTLGGFALYVRATSLFAGDEPTGPGPFRTEGCRRLQRWAGAIMWGWIMGHVVALWVCLSKLDPNAFGQYEFLRGFLSMPATASIYVVGLAATGLFTAQGLGALARESGVVRRVETSRWFEGFTTVIALGLVVLSVNVLSHYVTGRALWFSGEQPPSATTGSPPVKGAR